MIFKSKRIIHNKGEFTEISEVIANVEFSEGDLKELMKILDDYCITGDWGTILLDEIKKALSKPTDSDES